MLPMMLHTLSGTTALASTEPEHIDIDPCSNGPTSGPTETSRQRYTKSRRKPTTEVLSFTHKFTKSQTDVSDAVEPNLFSEDRGEE